jgi:uncharacterized membrane protein YcaP (DUF421 family)
MIMFALFEVLDAALGLAAERPEQLAVSQVCLRAAVVFLVLIAYLRAAKKRFLGQATVFDAILVIVIGSIASRAISGTAPFGASLAGTFTLILMHWLLSYVLVQVPALGGLVKGHSTVLIRNGKIDRDALRSAHMMQDDLEEDLRANGVGAASAVKEARLERSGKLSVIRAE